MVFVREDIPVKFLSAESKEIQGLNFRKKNGH